MILKNLVKIVKFRHSAEIRLSFSACTTKKHFHRAITLVADQKYSTLLKLNFVFMFERLPKTCFTLRVRLNFRIDGHVYQLEKSLFMKQITLLSGVCYDVNIIQLKKILLL